MADGKSGGGAFSADMLSGVKLKRTEVHESSGDASRDELKPYGMSLAQKTKALRK